MKGLIEQIALLIVAAEYIWIGFMIGRALKKFIYIQEERLRMAKKEHKRMEEYFPIDDD